MVKVFNADAVPMPLRFDTLEQALTYVGRTPGTLRIVEVDDEGERMRVERAHREAPHKPPSHYEVELRQAAPGDGRTGATWRAVRRVGPDGTMAPLTFGSLEAAQAHAERLRPEGGEGRGGRARRLAPDGRRRRGVRGRVRG